MHDAGVGARAVHLEALGAARESAPHGCAGDDPEQPGRGGAARAGHQNVNWARSSTRTLRRTMSRWRSRFCPNPIEALPVTFELKE